MTNTTRYTEAEMQEMLCERSARAVRAGSLREVLDIDHELALEEDRSRAAGKALLESASYASALATDLQAVKQKLNDELEAAKRARVEASRRMMKLERDLQEEQARRAQGGEEFAVKTMREQKAMLDHAQATVRRLGAQNAVLKAMICAVAKVEP